MDRTSPAYVARRDRAVEDDAWIRDFLKTAPVGMLATVSDGQPFINSNIFVYDDANHCIYMHTAKQGRTRKNIASNGEKVCFSIMEMGRLLPASEALEFSVEYAGVVVFGDAHIVEDREEALAGLQLLMDKYAPHLKPGEDYRPPVEEELPRTAVYRINISAWSGKKKEVEGFDGAYWYPESPVLPSVKARQQSGD